MNAIEESTTIMEEIKEPTPITNEVKGSITTMIAIK